MTQATDGGSVTPAQLEEEWNSVAQEREAPAPAETSLPVEPEVTPGEPAQADPTAEKPEEKPPETPVDPLASMPKEMQERLAKVEQLERLVLQQSNDMKAAIGRVASMQSELALAKKAAQVAGSGNAPSQAQMAAASKTPEKWEAMKADFPDWGEAIDEMVNHRLASAQQPVDTSAFAQRAEAMQADLEATKATMKRELEEAKVELKHGDDWKTTVNSKDFQDWFAAQDATTKVLAQSPRGMDAIKLLDKFVEAKAKPVEQVKSERSNRLAAAATARPGQTPPPKNVEDMTFEEQWNFYAKQKQVA